MKKDTVQIASAGNEFEAEHMRAFLAENGIRAFVIGGATQTALSYVGTAIGGVKVVVDTDDKERASSLLAEMDNGSSTEAWYCGHCEVDVDAGFDICWSCGKSRTKAEAVRDSLDEDQSADRVDANVNVAPEKHVTVNQDLGHEATTEFELASQVGSAWRAACLGFTILPFFTHAYAIYVLASTFKSLPNASPAIRKTWKRATIVAFAGMVIWITILFIFLRPGPRF